MKRTVYAMVCPKCGYTYSVALFEEYTYEHCPCCPYQGLFKEFVRKETQEDDSPELKE
jgi:ssDNA-binding Zn-finger/Zn-ribbon topoisomerase 1